MAKATKPGPSPAPDGAWQKRLFVCYPDFIGTDGKVYLELRGIDEDHEQVEAKGSLFERGRHNRNLKVGCVYEIEVSGPSYRLQRALHKGVLVDGEQRLQLRTQQRAFELTLAAKKLQDKESDIKADLDAALDVVRRVYHSMSFSQRAAFDVMVLNSIHKGAL